MTERESHADRDADPVLTGEILDDDAEIPRAHDITPTLIARQRRRIEQGRDLARALMVVAPPPARVPLAVASLLADAALIADDMGRRRDEPALTGLRGAALVLEGAAVLAVSRYAPARLAANLGGIKTARRALDRIIAKRVVG